MIEGGRPFRTATAIAVLVGLEAVAFAQSTPPASDTKPAALPPKQYESAIDSPETLLSRGAAASDEDPSEERPTSHEWRLRYDEARAKLSTGDFADAAVRFAELERSATNRVDRAIAHVQRTLADEWTARNLAFVHRLDLADPALSARAVDKRSTDELVSLYTTAVLYGIGAGLWLASLTKPKTAAIGIIPTLALTAGSVGTVLALDSGRGFRYGIPQAITSGTFVGLEHGLAWALWADSTRASITSEAAATLTFSLASVGAVTGGLLGHYLGTTPGRSSWVGSTALWTGTLVGLTVGALTGEDSGASAGLAAAGVGLSAGTAIGVLTASSVSPSIGHVRLIDLSAVLGALSAGALYFAIANNKSNATGAAGATALGTAAGLGIGWYATASMPPDQPRSSSEARDDSSSWLARWRPMISPVTRTETPGVAAPAGLVLGAQGPLD